VDEPPVIGMASASRLRKIWFLALEPKKGHSGRRHGRSGGYLHRHAGRRQCITGGAAISPAVIPRAKPANIQQKCVVQERWKSRFRSC
jgi:hypothetical protein